LPVVLVKAFANSLPPSGAPPPARLNDGNFFLPPMASLSLFFFVTTLFSLATDHSQPSLRSPKGWPGLPISVSQGLLLPPVPLPESPQHLSIPAHRSCNSVLRAHFVCCVFSFFESFFFFFFSFPPPCFLLPSPFFFSACRRPTRFRPPVPACPVFFGPSLVFGPWCQWSSHRLLFPSFSIVPTCLLFDVAMEVFFIFSPEPHCHYQNSWKLPRLMLFAYCLTFFHTCSFPSVSQKARSFFCPFLWNFCSQNFRLANGFSVPKPGFFSPFLVRLFSITQLRGDSPWRSGSYPPFQKNLRPHGFGDVVANHAFHVLFPLVSAGDRLRLSGSLWLFRLTVDSSRNIWDLQFFALLCHFTLAAPVSTFLSFLFAQPFPLPRLFFSLPFFPIIFPF